jgi:hypothetical protein
VGAGAERRPVGIGGVGIGQERADPALPEAGAVVADVDVVDADDVRPVAGAAAVVADAPDQLDEIRAGLPLRVRILGLDQQDAIPVLVPGMLRESRRWELPEWRNACPANRPAGSVAPLVGLIVQLEAATFATLA